MGRAEGKRVGGAEGRNEIEAEKCGEAKRGTLRGEGRKGG